MSKQINRGDKKRLAIVTAIGGTIKGLLLAQVEAALRAGYEVHGICTKGPYSKFLTDRGMIMYPVTIKRKISPFSDLLAFWKMYKYFKSEKIDIVHTHTPKCSLWGQLAAKLAGVPVVINTVHGFYFHENMQPAAKRFYVLMEKIAAKYSNVILSQNPEDVETAVKLGICNRDKIKLLGNGVDLNKFNPQRFDDNFIKNKRKEIGIPENAMIVGIIGRLVREKGFLDLFEAMKAVTANNKNVWLLIIGGEDTVKSDCISAQMFWKFGIDEKARWLGRREDIPELLSCCDIYTLPSWREGFPRSAIEAAAMGLPIVATNIRGCRQVVNDGINGLLVPLCDIEQLEKALMKLIDNPELRRKMGRAGYEKARLEFDERKVCDIVISEYNKFYSSKK